MDFKTQAIKDQFKPLDFYYEKERSKFHSNDIDLIDKAERYLEEAVTGKNAAKMKRYEISQNVQDLMKFVDWAKARGGDAMNDGVK